ncbi:MAG: hypothetical protein EB130_09100 [Actinobacteria bacterium]|nr:hypothetical protein [Actinomycetota bacterium]
MGKEGPYKYLAPKEGAFDMWDPANVSPLVAYLSSIVELLPGDVIFTGTPSGVGGARKPPEFLKPGDVVMSTLHGVASITNRCV